MLSDIAKTDENSRTKISALSEIHKQSGDDVIKMNLDVEGESIIRYVDIALPKINMEEEDEEEIKMDKDITIEDLLND